MQNLDLPIGLLVKDSQLQQILVTSNTLASDITTTSIVSNIKKGDYIQSVGNLQKNTPAGDVFTYDCPCRK